MCASVEARAHRGWKLCSTENDEVRTGAENDEGASGDLKGEIGNGREKWRRREVGRKQKGLARGLMLRRGHSPHFFFTGRGRHGVASLLARMGRLEHFYASLTIAKQGCNHSDGGHGFVSVGCHVALGVRSGAVGERWKTMLGRWVPGPLVNGSG